MSKKESLQKRLNDAKARELYKKIRDETDKKILETGKRWIVCVDNIPMGQVTSEELLTAIDYLKENAPDRLNRIKILNLLDKKYYTVDEVKLRLR